jgi:hypothetical protein
MIDSAPQASHHRQAQRLQSEMMSVIPLSRE